MSSMHWEGSIRTAEAGEHEGMSSMHWEGSIRTAEAGEHEGIYKEMNHHTQCKV